MDGSDLSLIENYAFSGLAALSSLSLVSATGLSHFPVSLLEGPASLRSLNLSGVNLFPDRLGDDAFFQYLMGMKSAPLSDLRTYNLTGSLANVDFPMELVKLSSMHRLEELVLSEVCSERVRQ